MVGWCRTSEPLTFLNKVTKVTGGGGAAQGRVTFKDRLCGNEKEPGKI